MATLTHKTTTGVFWSLLQKFASRGITVLVTLVLAYFIAPGDFGLVAMMAVFLVIANSLTDSGFRQALIRMKEANSVDFNADCQGLEEFHLSRSSIELSEPISAALRKSL